MFVQNKCLLLASLIVCCYAPGLLAEPLPAGTVLSIETGNTDADACTVGSCFGMEIAPDYWVWTIVNPGNDGGFIVGKNQLSGGQEGPFAPSTTPGDITAAWNFFGSFGTFFADNTLNTFSDTSSDGGTSLNDYNIAWSGYVIPMAGPTAQGVINNYSITLDGNGGGSWSFDYNAIVPEGLFIGLPFRMLVRGSVTVPVDNAVAPIVNDVAVVGDSGELTNWTPDFTDTAGDTHTCVISGNAANGNATVNNDCSGGTYTSGAGYEGTDSFSYSVTDQTGLSATGRVTILISPSCSVYDPTKCPPPPCYDYPVIQVVTAGGGQSPTVNATLHATFTGHITTQAGLTSGGKNTVKICPGSTVDFTVTSSTGNVSCIINSAATASTGTLAIGDKLICTNKPDGSDVDRFSIKSGI